MTTGNDRTTSADSRVSAPAWAEQEVPEAIELLKEAQRRLAAAEASSSPASKQDQHLLEKMREIVDNAAEGVKWARWRVGSLERALRSRRERPVQHDRLFMSRDEDIAPGTFGISLEAARSIPRDWEGLTSTDASLRAIAQAERDERRTAEALEWARRRADTMDMTRVRLVVGKWARDKWAIVPDEDDAALGGWDDAAGTNSGCEIVGVRLDMSYLSRDQQVLLLYLLATRSNDPEQWAKWWYLEWIQEPLSPSQEAIQRALLSMCPREVRLPPIDLDANDDRPDFTPEAAGALSADYARRIEGFVAERPEYGLPRFYTSSLRKRSMHVDFMAPEGFASAHLPEAWGALVAPMLLRLGIPSNGIDLKGVDKEARPAIFADTTLYQKYPDSRGGLWRPPGASKPERKDPKRLVPDLSHPSETVLERRAARDWPGREVSADALRRAVALVASSEHALKRAEGVEKNLRLALAGQLDGGVSLDRQRIRSAIAVVRQQPAEAAMTPRARPREAGSAPELDARGAAEALSKILRGLPPGAEATSAAAACMVCRFPRQVVAAAVAGSGRCDEPAAAAAVDSLEYSDSGQAWDAITAGLGQRAEALLGDIEGVRLSRRILFVPPAWALAISRAAAAGMRPITERDIPDAALRRYVEAQPALTAAWFSVTGDRSHDENEFAKACHATELSAAEAVYLCVIKPGSKSRERGEGYAEQNVRRLEELRGPFGPGVSDLEEPAQAAGEDPAAAAARLATRDAERERRRAERAAGRNSRKERRGEEHFRPYPKTTVRSFGDAAFPATAAALSAARPALYETDQPGAEVRLLSDVGSRYREATVAVATWLLAEGVPEEAAAGTLAASLCDVSYARQVVEEACKALESGHQVRGEHWVQAVLTAAHAAVSPVLSRELRERNAEARARFVAERDAETARRHMASAADALHGHEHHRHHNGAPGPAPGGQAPGGQAPGGGGGGQPADWPPAAFPGGRPLGRLVRYIVKMFSDSSRATPKAASALLAFLVGSGMPASAVEATFRMAGLPEADHVWDATQEHARRNPDVLRGALVAEVGERSFRRVIGAISVDLAVNDSGLDHDLRERLYANFVGRWHLTDNERWLMLLEARRLFNFRPIQRPEMPPLELRANESLATRLRRVSRGLRYAANCGMFKHYIACDKHGDRGSRSLVTDREIACRHCNRRWARAYSEWVTKSWPERVNLVKVQVPDWSPPPGKAATWEERLRWRTSVEHMRETSAAATRIKQARWGEVYDRVGSGEAAAAAAAAAAQEPPGQPPAPDRRDDEDDEDAAKAWGEWVVGLRDPLTGHDRMPGMPQRWVYGRDHFLLIMPVFRAAVMECEETAPDVVAKYTASVNDPTLPTQLLARATAARMEHFARFHRGLGRAVREPSKLVGHPITHHLQRIWQWSVTREEAAKEIHRSLMSLGEAFDDALRDGTPALGYYEWLTPGIKRTTASGGGKQLLPWPDRDEVRDFMAAEAKEKNPELEELKPGQCDADEPDPANPGKTKKCGLLCRVTLVHEPTGTVVAQNASGILYNIEDADQRRSELGVPEVLPFDDLE